MARRDSGAADALMGVSNIMGGIVLEKYPDSQMSWPCMTGYKGEAFEHEHGVVLVLKNTPRNSIPVVGLSKEKRQFSNLPEMEMTYQNVDEVINSLNAELGLSEYDIAINIFKDLSEWSGDYKNLDEETWSHVYNQIDRRVEQMNKILPKRQIVNNKVVTTIGDNNKVLVDSIDNSINVTVNGDIYDELLGCLKDISDENERNDIESSIVEMKEHHGSPSYLAKYQEFMGKVANHVTVFGPLIATLGASLGKAMGS